MKKLPDGFNDLKRLLRKVKRDTRRESRSNSNKLLRVRVWLEHILKSEKTNVKKLNELMFLGEGRNSRTITRWLSGNYLPSNNSLNKMFKCFPNSRGIYEHPVFTLLETNITKKRLKELIHRYTKLTSLHPEPDKNSNCLKIEVWNFPSTSESRRSYRENCFQLFDAESLFQRGDEWGFIGILILLRQAELERNSDYHLHYIKYAYKAFPAFARSSLFYKRRHDFFDELQKFNSRFYTTQISVRPRYEIIERQIHDKDFHPQSVLRPMNPRTGRYEEVDEPYIEAKFHSSDC